MSDHMDDMALQADTPTDTYRTETTGTGRWYTTMYGTVYTDGDQVLGIWPRDSTAFSPAEEERAAQLHAHWVGYLRVMFASGYSAENTFTSLHEMEPSASPIEDGDLSAVTV